MVFKVIVQISRLTYDSCALYRSFLDCFGINNRLDPQIGRFFEESKSDASAVNDWNSKLSKWGEKSLEKLGPEERTLELARREAGAAAAREATRTSVSNGGEITIGPVVSDNSPLSASRNMLMLALSPSDLLDRILLIMEATSYFGMF